MCAAHQNDDAGRQRHSILQDRDDDEDVFKCRRSHWMTKMHLNIVGIDAISARSLGLSFLFSYQKRKNWYWYGMVISKEMSFTIHTIHKGEHHALVCRAAANYMSKSPKAFFLFKALSKKFRKIISRMHNDVFNIVGFSNAKSQANS